MCAQTQVSPARDLVGQSGGASRGVDLLVGVERLRCRLVGAFKDRGSESHGRLLRFGFLSLGGYHFGELVQERGHLLGGHVAAGPVDSGLTDPQSQPHVEPRGKCSFTAA